MFNNNQAISKSRRALIRAGLFSSALSPLGFRVNAASSAEASAAISPITLTVSDYIAAAGVKAIPEAATEAAKHHLLDTIAAMISGTHLLAGERAIAYINTQGGTPQACVPGTKIITTVVNSALTGGMLAHADETDDSHAASLTHPGAGVVPAALAMAEFSNAKGVELLRAVALGYDINCRMSFALGDYAFARLGHGTHSFGPMFGATAACAALAKLTPRQVRHALSYTTQQASGLSNFARDTEHVEKAFQFGGLPARNGAASVTMLASGMSGIDDPFGGPNNFFFASGPTAKPELLIQGLGETFEVVNTNIKRWTVGSPIQAPLDSVYDLMKEYKFKASDVEKVVVRVFSSGAEITNNRSMPDINMQYMISVMLLDGTASLEAAHDVARMQDPQVMALRKRVELIGDPELERALPSRQAIVDITLKDERVLHSHTKSVRGTFANPMTRAEVGEKAFDLCAPVLGKQKAAELVAHIWDLEKISNVVSLRSLLQPA